MRLAALHPRDVHDGRVRAVAIATGRPYSEVYDAPVPIHTALYRVVTVLLSASEGDSMMCGAT